MGNNNCIFGHASAVFDAAMQHDTEVRVLFGKVMLLSNLISECKGRITMNKRRLNEAVVALQHYNMLRAFNLPLPTNDPSVYRDDITNYTEALHAHQKGLRKIHAEHNKIVEELKSALDKFARTCAIRHAPQQKKMTMVKLDRKRAFILLKQLTDTLKDHPDLTSFYVNIEEQP